MSPASIRVTALQNEPLDALVWRALGSVPGAIERTLELNPGLAAMPFLAAGTPVLLPSIDPEPRAEIVQLWT
jgi:phage tail protein X